MNRNVNELWTLGCTGNWQQGIQAAKELFKLEQEERRNTPTQDAIFFREGGELKSNSKADTLLLKRLAILRQHLNIESLSRSEYSKRKRVMRRKYVGDQLEDTSNSIYSMELELSQGLLRKSKIENMFFDQILLSSNKSVLATVKYWKKKITNPLLLQQISSIVVIATANISSLQPMVELKAQGFTRKLQNGLYDREELLNEICKTPFSETSFKDYAHQILGLSKAEEKLKSIRKREYSHLEHGSWPYLSLSGHDVLNAIRKLKPGKNDVLTEVGCGLGINAIFVGLTTAMRVEGFDINPDWVKLANQVSSDIRRADIIFYVQDACSASYEDTNIFLIFSPFSEQSLIEKMLERIEHCAKQRPITIMAAYDDLINVLDEVSWVKPTGTVGAIEIFKN